MHTTYHKISARERDHAPRYYYKRTRELTCLEKLAAGFRQVLAFLFTQVGVCALIGLYMVLGAFTFASIEAESQMQEALVAAEMRSRFAS